MGVLGVAPGVGRASPHVGRRRTCPHVGRRRPRLCSWNPSVEQRIKEQWGFYSAVLCRSGDVDQSGGSVEARIAAAKAYKAKIGKKGGDSGAQERFEAYAEELAKEETGVFLEAQDKVEEWRKEQGSEVVEVRIERGQMPGTTSSSVEQVSSSVDDTKKNVNNKGGNGEAAASWLQSISKEGGVGKIDSGLRAEEFTMEKERRFREQEVVIERAKGVVAGTNRKVTQVDDYGIAQQFQDAEISMAKEREENNSLHKPKVATWGVFPRPQNISKTYGGGRNIRPGQALETEEEAAERGKRVSEALAQYRKVAGLDIDPEVEEKATGLYEQGQELFEAGSIRAALEKYSEAADLVPLKSKIGGLANFQKAVCLDSLGRNDDAYPIYKSLSGHSAPGVAKNSKRMLFGFQAAKDLKVDKMSYTAGSVDQWRGYFDRATDGSWSVYSKKNEEEDEDQEKTSAILATAVMLFPIACIFSLVVASK